MESLMSGLMARAAGKANELPPFLMTSHVHHAESFVSNEDLRHHGCYTSSDEETSSSIASSPEPCFETSSVSPTATPVGGSYQSFQSFYGASCYATPPTYVQGDFYHLSPSPVPSAIPSGISNRQAKRLSFSIDSILGQTEEAESRSSDKPAQVTSALTSGDFRFSQSDWSVFQPPNRPSSSRTEENEKLYWCHACEEFCANGADVTHHQTTHNRNGDVCRLRRVFFNSHGYVTAHGQTDLLNRLKCGLCERVVTRHFFHKHLRLHDGHICHVCGHECATNGRLLDHMNKHTGASPYRCQVCDQHFSDKQQLLNHSRKHRQTSTQCRFCSKMFKSKYSCTVHERIHTGVHPFVCSVSGCSKSFPQKIQLQLHENYHTKLH